MMDPISDLRGDLERFYLMSARKNNPVNMSGGNGKSGDEDTKLRRALSQFESLFVYQILKTMRATIPKSGFFGSAPGKEFYDTMFDQEVSKKMSGKKGMGLSKLLYQQLKKSE